MQLGRAGLGGRLHGEGLVRSCGVELVHEGVEAGLLLKANVHRLSPSSGKFDPAPRQFVGLEFRLAIDAIEERYGRRSTMIASHVSVDRWHEIIADPAYADAILDRLLHIGGSQLVDQLGFRRRWEGRFNDRADGRAINRFRDERSCRHAIKPSDDHKSRTHRHFA